jgi:hypothetical protein
MLDAWIIEDLIRREQPARELPLLQLPLEFPVPREPASDVDEAEEEPGRSGRVIVIDMT